MTITSKTRKMLWGRAGARCSFCHIELIQVCELESGGTILGEEAHIIAQKKDGPRGENMIEHSRLDLYENLILLCPTHHTLIDAQPTKYTADVIYQMKKTHESWVDHNLGVRNRAQEVHYVPDPAYKRFCDHRLIHIWKYPKAHIICCSYGSNPVEILSGIWKACGIEFYRFPGGNLNEAPEFIIDVSEAEPEVEYRCDSEALEVTTHTYDPRISGFTPFMTMRFEHDRPIKNRLVTLRLVPETSPIEDILNFLRQPRGSISFETIEEKLYRLRNVGISIPRKALELTSVLWGSWWCDGATAESLQDIERQFKMVIEAEQVE